MVSSQIGFVNYSNGQTVQNIFNPTYMDYTEFLDYSNNSNIYNFDYTNPMIYNNSESFISHVSEQNSDSSNVRAVHTYEKKNKESEKEGEPLEKEYNLLKKEKLREDNISSPRIEVKKSTEKFIMKEKQVKSSNGIENGIKKEKEMEKWYFEDLQLYKSIQFCQEQIEKQKKEKNFSEKTPVVPISSKIPFKPCSIYSYPEPSSSDNDEIRKCSHKSSTSFTSTTHNTPHLPKKKFQGREPIPMENHSELLYFLNSKAKEEDFKANFFNYKLSDANSPNFPIGKEFLK